VSKSIVVAGVATATEPLTGHFAVKMSTSREACSSFTPAKLKCVWASSNTVCLSRSSSASSVNDPLQGAAGFPTGVGLCFEVEETGFGHVGLFSVSRDPTVQSASGKLHPGIHGFAALLREDATETTTGGRLTLKPLAPPADSDRCWAVERPSSLRAAIRHVGALKPAMGAPSTDLVPSRQGAAFTDLAYGRCRMNGSGTKRIPCPDPRESTEPLWVAPIILGLLQQRLVAGGLRRARATRSPSPR
jgi:hypothetical protein